MSKERELLERVSKHFDETLRPLDKAILTDSIRDFLSTPEPTQDEEPVAWRVRRSVNHEWLTVGIEESASHCKESGWIVEPLFLHLAPRPEFVRLSEEEIVSWWGVATEAGLIEFARSIEDALERKNK